MEKLDLKARNSVVAANPLWSLRGVSEYMVVRLEPSRMASSFEVVDSGFSGGKRQFKRKKKWEAKSTAWTGITSFKDEDLPVDKDLI